MASDAGMHPPADACGRAPAREHIGIELRVRCPAGVLVLADSDRLYYIARFGSHSSPAHGFTCLPDCRIHGWYEMFPGTDMTYVGSDLIIEMRPVRLADPPPDPGEEEERCNKDFLDASVDCELPLGHDGMHMGSIEW